ncbi:MAG: DNA methyltransferase, partial [Thermoplasmata archaeon]
MSEFECPQCGKIFESGLGEHIRRCHGEDMFNQAVLDAKKRGVPDAEIGAIFGISFKQLENLMLQTYGVNISGFKTSKKVRYWEPKKFREETTTVWSYKQRGDWATHSGRFRGNWSPYIPRNIILKYSQPGDVVLDFFVGSGTTAIEAKLLGRKCIARDINPACVELTLENLKFNPPPNILYPHIYEPEVKVGDARNLSDIPDNSIDLICTHPPYAGIINYSSNVEGDLSKLSIEEFLTEMKKVADESYRVLKPGKKCAILIGDTRKHKHVIPVGFKTINVFLEVGFKLKELVIKRQHNCKTTGFWYKKSIQYNFLLLAHEYLPIFEKPLPSETSAVMENGVSYGRNIMVSSEKLFMRKINELET